MSIPCSQQPTTCPYRQPVHSHPTHVFKIHINTIFPFKKTTSPKWYLSSRFLQQNSVCIYPLPHACHMPRPFILIDLINSILFSGKYRSRSPSSCHLIQLPDTSALLSPNIHLSTAFLNTFSLWLSVNVT